MSNWVRNSKRQGGLGFVCSVPRDEIESKVFRGESIGLHGRKACLDRRQTFLVFSDVTVERRAS